MSGQGRDAHRQRMEERRKRQLARKSDYPRRVGRFLYVLFKPTRNDDPAYRKSIWPAAKIARRREAA